MLWIKRNLDGSFKTNRIAHTADLMCDQCNMNVSEVDLNNNAVYIITDNIVSSIQIECNKIGGTCGSSTCWPIVNGSADAIEIALVKSA